ncbi:MAG: helix-turn-helix domain-containing protein [Clostridiales bacterium]|nr:helix-turn-helix domain-containing protein [Clostridiales bacterium]
MDIGAKIKAIRLQRGLTQEELAHRCELTKGYISQLENEIASPSIATLMDILNVLGVTLQSFFTEPKKEKIVFGKNDFFESKNGSGKNLWLIPNSQKNEMEPIILELPQGGESELRLPFEGEEFGYILEGRVEIELGNQKFVYKAKKGEAFYIDGKYEHKLRNIFKGRSRVLWVTTPSNF